LGDFEAIFWWVQHLTGGDLAAFIAMCHCGDDKNPPSWYRINFEHTDMGGLVRRRSKDMAGSIFESVFWRRGEA